MLSLFLSPTLEHVFLHSDGLQKTGLAGYVIVAVHVAPQPEWTTMFELLPGLHQPMLLGVSIAAFSGELNKGKKKMGSCRTTDVSIS